MNKQSFITILLAVLMSMAGAKAFAHDIEVANSDGVTIYYVWTNNNTELAVSYRGSSSGSYSNDYSGNVVIPSSVEYNGNTYPVTSIGYDAFYECSGLTSVTIPNSVTSIGAYAFYYCSGLTSVTIPNSVTFIGDDAFLNCSGLATIFSEIKTPFEISDITDNTVTLIVPTGTKAAYQSTAGWSSFTKTVEVGEGGLVGSKFKIDGIYYKIGENNTVSLTFMNRAISDALEIHGQVEFNGKNYSVTSIGNSAFQNCYGLTSVTIPNSVTSIGYEAFRFCSNLTSVTIPNSVTSIGECAFYNCSGLSTIVSEIITPFEISYIADNTVTLIVPTGTKAAYQSTAGWSSFTKTVEVGEGGVVGSKVVIDDIYYTICENNSASLTSANKSISGAFEIPSQVEYNGKKYDVTSIGYQAFSSCNGLTSVTIPNSVTSIGNGAFQNCSGLTSVTIPNSVTSIGSSAFYQCRGLTSVIIGSGVLSIGEDAFSNTNLQKTIWLTNTPPSGYSYAKGTVNYVSNDQFGIRNQVVYKFLSSNFVVNGIRYVPVSPSDRTCDAIDCIYDESAENINIGETVTNKGVTLTVMKVNPYACYQNKHIKDVKLSFGGDIGDYAFYGCSGLNTATVSNKGSIGAYAFQSCSALTTATINNQGVISNYVFSGCSLLETAELGQNVTSIGSYAFSECSKLKSIVIPDAVTSLGSSAFASCSAMTSAKIGNGIETIEGYTFSGCSSIIKMNIGSKVKTISQNAFSGCSSLPAITIPQAVTNIGNNVFYKCTSLAKVTIADSEATLTLGCNYNSYSNSDPIFSSCPLDYVYIGRDISYKTSSKYGYSPFYRNTSLRAVKITDKETEISENEFYGCTNLQQVEIGDGVTTIGNWAFSGCSSLKYFAFGTQVANIGQEAFSDCTAMEEIISKAQAAPACGSQALDDINKWECKLYVPDNCMAIYEAADQWMDFFFKEEGEGTLPQGGDNPENPDGSKKCETPIITVDGSSVKFDCKTSGVIFHYTISSSDAKSDITNSGIEVKNSYTISVYASKDGYTDSEVAKKSFQMAGAGKKGDVNGDNKVDVADHVELSKIILEQGQ